MQEELDKEYKGKDKFVEMSLSETIYRLLLTVRGNACAGGDGPTPLTVLGHLGRRPPCLCSG